MEALRQELRMDLKVINEKLTKVLTRDDEGLKQLIRDTIIETKDGILKAVNERIEKLESQIFDKEQENDHLKKENLEMKVEISRLKSDNDSHKKAHTELKNDVTDNERKAEEWFNKQEQYSRSNNIRIYGIPEQKFPKVVVKYAKQNRNEGKTQDNEKETNEITSGKVSEKQAGKTWQQ